MKTRAAILAAAATAMVLALSPSAPARAQANDQAAREPGSYTAQKGPVGAGTTDGTTTGQSGPDEGAGGGGPPPLPSADLCKDYEGKVHDQCLALVLAPESPQPTGG